MEMGRGANFATGRHSVVFPLRTLYLFALDMLPGAGGRLENNEFTGDVRESRRKLH